MKESESKQRIRYIDYARALGMLLVILGHINFANSEIKAWIYSFHMPLFFFISGMTLKTSQGIDERNVWKYLRKRMYLLMVPYFVWALVYASLDMRNCVRILYGSHQTLTSAGSLTSLWFLPVLLEATAMFLAANWILKNRFNGISKLILIPLTFLIAFYLPKFKYGYPMGINLAFYAFGFLLLGNLCAPAIASFRNKQLNRGHDTIWWCIAAVGALIGTFLYKLNLPNGSYVNTANAEYGSVPIFLIAAMCGILFIMAVSILLDIVCSSHLLKNLVYIGQNTLGFFVTQKPIIRIFQSIFNRVKMPTAVELIITWICTVFLCYMLVMILNKYIPVIVGKPMNSITSQS